MATKKAAARKSATSEPATQMPVKTPAKKTAAKKTAAKGLDVQASSTESQPKPAAAKSAEKHRPSHGDISVQAYLLWERDGKKHGREDHYWKQAERDLLEQ